MCWNLHPPLPTPVKARSAVMHAAIEIRYFAHAVSHALYVLGKTVVHESLKLLLHVSFHFSVAGLCQYPFKACFEEVWVVNDGAELQNCGTLKITLEGEDNGIRHSVWLCFELAIYWGKRSVYTHFYTLTPMFLMEPHKHTPHFDTRKPLKSNAMHGSLMP